MSAVNPEHPKVPEPTGALTEGQRVVFRSMPVLRTSISLTVLLVGGSAMLWYGLGPQLRSQFTMPQIVTLLFFIVFMAGLMLSIGFSELVATSDGVKVRNCVVTRRYPWSRVLGANMGSGDAWANLSLTGDDLHPDGETHMVLAVQRAEGERSAERLAELNALIVANRPEATGGRDADELPDPKA